MSEINFIEKKSKYRPEIDGLRALAVFAVIINHFNEDILPSGFLGVDIFFVISGYVITSSLDGRKSKNFLNFLSSFYERRIKRILPALIFYILLASFLVFLFSYYPARQISTGIRALFGISNIFLYIHSWDYFGQPASLNAFTHTWSLGVEEQFYFFFPIFIWFSGFAKQLKGGSRNLSFIIGILSVISLSSFIVLSKTDINAAYYLMPPRFWEMSSGCLIYLCIKKEFFIIKYFKKFPALLIMILIIGIFFLPKEISLFSTIGIVFLTTLLLCNLRKNSKIFDFLTNKKIIFFGLSSYSLYLWHWGVLSISRMTIGLYWWTIPFQILIIFLLSSCSYIFIETPIRALKFYSKSWKVISLGIGSLFLSFLGLFSFSKLYNTSKNELFIGNQINQELISGYSNRKNQGKVIDFSAENCHLDARVTILENIDFNKCKINQGNNNWFYFTGNSHSGHYLETYLLLSERKKINIDSVSSWACEFPPNFTQKDCGEFQNFQQKRILQEIKKDDLLIVSNRYELFDKSSRDSRDYTWFDSKKSIESFLSFAKKINSKGAKIILFAPSPEFDQSIHFCMPEWFRPILPKGCSISETRLRFLRENLYKSLSDLPEYLLIYDPKKALCFNNLCKMTDSNNKPLYFDKNHLTIYANREYIYPDFVKFLEQNNLIKN